MWDIPIVFILEKNNISQSTSFDQNFAGNIKDRVTGFNIKYFHTSVYDLFDLDKNIKEAFLYTRENSKPVFIEIEKKIYDKYNQRNSQVSWQLYNHISLFWELVGDMNKVAQINKNMTTLVEQKEQAFGLGLYLEENWTQYYRENP